MHLPDRQSALVELENLRVNFYSRRGVVQAVRGIDISIRAGETLGIVGESGSGKSVTAMAMLGLVPPPGRIVDGTMRWLGDDVTAASRLAQLRGRKITMIFQDPMAGLNPLVPVGRQITEVLRKHRNLSRSAARDRATELLGLTGITLPKTRMKQYPFELSGGMAQRVMIAMALAPEPELIIADEPTSALDVTVQAQILELLAELQTDLGLAIMLITHDLGVVAGICQRVAVIYAGRIVEEGSTRSVLEHPSHPYTAALKASSPRIDRPGERLPSIAGNPPNLIGPDIGCAFAPRCSRVTERCRIERPDLARHGDSLAACWHPLGLGDG